MVKLMRLCLLNRQVMKLIGLYECLDLQGVLTYHTTMIFYASALNKIIWIHLLIQTKIQLLLIQTRNQVLLYVCEWHFQIFSTKYDCIPITPKDGTSNTLVELPHLVKVAKLIKAYPKDTWFSIIKNITPRLESEGLWWKDDKLVIPKAAGLYSYFESIMTHPHKWHSKSMDLITQLPPTKNGNTCIVVFVD